MSAIPPFAPAATAPRRRRSSWALRITFAVLVLGLLGAAAVAAALMGFALFQMGDSRPALAGDPATIITRARGQGAADGHVWDRHGPVNVLLIGADKGIDEGCTETSYQLTDTLILVRFDPASGRAGMMSIPRDLYVPMPGRGARKITTAYAIGERGTPGGGPELLRETIEENLDVPVHRYVRVDVHGFERIVDELGGIEIDVPPSRYDPSVGLYDPAYPDDNCGTVVVTFPPGHQRMNGKEALQYARSRKTTSDFDRSRRQMDVLMAIRRRAAAPRMVTRLPRLLPALFDTVATDFSAREVASLVAPAMDVGAQDIDRYPIDAEVVYDDWVVVDGVAQAVLRLMPAAYTDLRRRFMALEPLATPTVPAESAAITAAGPA